MDWIQRTHLAIIKKILFLQTTNHLIHGFCCYCLYRTPYSYPNSYFSLQSPEILFLFCKKTINSTHHNSLDSLEASIVAPFADMPREEITLGCSRNCYRIERVTKVEGGFIDFFSFFILFYTLILIQKNQADNVIIECVREKLFLCGFIVQEIKIFLSWIFEILDYKSNFTSWLK